MTHNDATAILTIATLASLADGEHDGTERAEIARAAEVLGLGNADEVIRSAHAGERDVASLATSLSTPEARQVAYDTATAVCYADGWISPSEATFLRELAALVSADVTSAADTIAEVNRAADDPAPGRNGPATEMDQYILDQAMLTAALEILPDRLANIGILPLQLRLVHHIGQAHGQQLDTAQVKDLAATFGLGAAAQVLEKAVRRMFGGLTGGILGGAVGSIAGLASGAAITFSTTYALGHVADRYYAQDRQLSREDLRDLYTRFRADAADIFPRAEKRIQELAGDGSLSGVLKSVR